MNGHKFCGHCGSELKAEEKFCGNCGSPVEAPAETIVSAPVETPAQPTSVPFENPTQLVQSVAPVASKKNINKKPIFIGAAIAAIALIVGIAFAIIVNLPKTRTFAVYMIGSNLESDGEAGTLDIKEMIDSKFDTKYAKVVIYTGGAKRWNMDGISANENAIFEVSSDGIKKVQTYDKKVMTQGDVLTEYLDYVYDNYKSDLYDLVLWDHGGGPISGYGSDENNPKGTPMLLQDLKSAIGNTKLVKDKKKFEIIGFDACLMGSIEVGNALKEYSNYMIASEESEPGYGWNYDFLSSVDGKIKSDELGKTVVERFMHHYDDYPYSVGLSLSVVDLSKIDELGKAADNLFNLVNSEVTNKNFSEYSKIMTRSNVYGYTGRDSESFDLVDLKDLGSALKDKHPDEVSKLTEAVEKAVVYSDTNLKDTHGISIYFPTNNKKYVEKFVQRYEDTTFSEDYYNFLKKYSSLILGKKVVSRSNFTDLREEKQGKGVSVELPDELVENYQKAEVVVYRKLGENKYAPVYRGSNVSLDGKNLKTDDMNLQFVVKAKEDGKESSGWITLYEKARTDEYAEYVSFGVLYYNDDSTLGFAPKSYEMHLRLNNGEKVAKVEDIKVQTTENGLSGKLSFDQSKIKIIEMTVPAYKLFNEAGERLDGVEGTGTLYGTSLNLEKGDSFEISLEDLNYDFGNMYEGELSKASLGDYYAEFVVYDTQGDSHRLNLIHV
ncbi:hypothetical protein J6W91_00820 [Candidatus Saccharibacteria bacterium]|nr:hypothetical protein [Candidatus Saccharibacteria bacterium]